MKKTAYKRVCESCNTNHFSSETKCRSCRGLVPIEENNNFYSKPIPNLYFSTINCDNKTKIICEHCREEITDEFITYTNDGAFHEEDCFMDYVYQQYAYTSSRENYLNRIKILEEKYGV